jgi:hypothetical protein
MMRREIPYKAQNCHKRQRPRKKKALFTSIVQEYHELPPFLDPDFIRAIFWLPIANGRKEIAERAVPYAG